MKVTKPFLIGLVLALVVLLLLWLWVMVDSTFVVRGDEINLITNGMKFTAVTVTGN